MSWTHKSRERLALRGHERFLKCDAFVTWQDGLADPDESITIAHGSRYMCDFVATGLPLLRCFA